MLDRQLGLSARGRDAAVRDRGLGSHQPAVRGVGELVQRVRVIGGGDDVVARQFDLDQERPERGFSEPVTPAAFDAPACHCRREVELSVHEVHVCERLARTDPVLEAAQQLRRLRDASLQQPQGSEPSRGVGAVLVVRSAAGPE